MRYRYSQSTVDRILRLISEQPGLTGRQIAKRLGLRKDHVNSWLYSEGKQKYGLHQKDWAWGHAGIKIPPRTRDLMPWERKELENYRRQAFPTEEQILRERERQWDKRNGAPIRNVNYGYSQPEKKQQPQESWADRQRSAFSLGNKTF